MVAAKTDAKTELPLRAPSRRLAWRLGFNILLAALVLYLVLVPLVTLVYSSLKVSGTSLPFEVPGFSLGNFSAIFRDPATVAVVTNTLIYVGGSVILGMLLSVGLTYLLERTDVPGRRLLSTFILTPMAVPGVVMAMAWAFLANPTNGPLSVLLHRLSGATVSVYSLWGMVVVTGFLVVPSMYLLIAPQFARFDAALEEAAAASGATQFRRIRRIVLPLLSPAIIAGATLLAVTALEVFDVPAILGFPRNIYVFSTLIQQSIEPPGGTPDYGRASGYGVILLIVASALALFYRHMVRAPQRFRTITGKGYRPARIRLGRWRVLALAAVVAYFVIGVVLPFLILVWASLRPYFSLPSPALLAHVSLANYAHLLSVPGVPQAALHTIIILLTSATATMLLSFGVAWVSVRKRFIGAPFLGDLTFLVLGVPGVVMGVALLYVYLELPLPLYGTVWIIVVAYVTRYMSYGVRLMDASLRQLDVELEEAGHVSGASRFAVSRKIVLPLMLPAMLRGWIWVAVHALAEVPMALLLSTNANQTIAVALWNLWISDANYSEASALAVILALVSGLGIWWVSRYAQAAEATTVVATI